MFVPRNNSFPMIAMAPAFAGTNIEMIHKVLSSADVCANKCDPACTPIPNAAATKEYRQLLASSQLPIRAFHVSCGEAITQPYPLQYMQDFPSFKATYDDAVARANTDTRTVSIVTPGPGPFLIQYLGDPNVNEFHLGFYIEIKVDSETVVPSPNVATFGGVAQQNALAVTPFALPAVATSLQRRDGSYIFSYGFSLVNGLKQRYAPYVTGPLNPIGIGAQFSDLPGGCSVRLTTIQSNPTETVVNPVFGTMGGN